ncbi:MAG: UvrD-helicase domain-containing protein, partial [Lachnospiraceae bacterium]|nr:UvrD-helicase domain-containing protein [Lachnospiraceae bacterium]
MRWTEDQERVINSRNRNLLVSAAAGSGKTAVLVERIVRMVTDEKHPVDLDRLLVMTFTNAAAAEMRERIGKAIGEKLSGEPENARLRLQMAIVPHAQIQTIDSFCLFLIRNHYAGLDIDPSFRVGDEGELTLLRSDVMAELLEDRYENGGEAFEQFVETYGSGRTDLGIEEVISQVYDFSVSHPWPKKWLAECRREFGEDGAEHFEETGWMQFLLQDVKRQMQEFAIQLADALEVCGEAGGPEAYLPAIREDLELVSGIRQAEDFQTLRLRLEQASFGKLKAIRSKEVEKEKKDYVSSIRDRVKKAVGKCRDQYASQTREEMVEAILGCAPAVCVLFDLAEEFLDRYQQAKKDRNLVDFGDLEHFALEVLYEEGKPSPAADELSRKYEEILVDEYQDSNYVQESLIQAVSRERFGTPNVFMVGDVKQSIYRFRQARPELFLEKYKRYGKEEGLYQKIELQKNFRSRSQVLDSINQVFYQIMGEALGGIRYTEEAALYPGAVFEPLPG